MSHDKPSRAFTFWLWFFALVAIAALLYPLFLELGG